MRGYRHPDEALLTDIYELTMAQSYLQQDMLAPATFSLFIRNYPPHRSYFVAAGLDDVLHYLEGLRFSSNALRYLRSTGRFSDDFLDYLRQFRFTGSVRAIPEGRLYFSNEPVVEVTGPIPEAQLVESFILNQINLQTLIATKASRCVYAAQGRTLVDFSLRRTQGTDAGMKVARCSYLVGFASSSNVLAGKVYGIPIAGTMAHSYITAFNEEVDAFRAYAASFPDTSVFLIDTYDTVEGARRAATVAKEMERQGHRLLAVRLDSGDLLALSRVVRRVLDDAGLQYVGVFASGGLDEYQVQELVEAGAPIAGFGVGTKMGVSGDAPWLDNAYKLVQYDGRPVLKLSTGKATLAGEKQVFRLYDDHGTFLEDVIARRDEELPKGGEPLLVNVMEDGRIVRPSSTLPQSRRRFQEEFARLPERYKALREPPEYPVRLSAGLERLQHQVTERVLQQTR